MKKFIIIKADTNDGDYITEKSKITDDQIKLITPVVDAIRNFEPYVGTKSDWIHKHRHNFPYGECLRKDLGEKSPEEMYGHIEGFELFENLIPYDEYGIHTIESVEIIEVTETEKLL